MKNLDYLRAEVDMARSMGHKKVLVSVDELQSILSILHCLKDQEIPKLFGYASGFSMRGLINGHRKNLRVRTKKSPIYNTPVYFSALAELTDEEKLRLSHMARAKRD